MEQTQVQAVPVRNKERDEQLRRDINELLLKHLQGGTTIAEMEMIGDNMFALVDRWNQKGRIHDPSER
jgi:hypothetical protein